MAEAAALAKCQRGAMIAAAGFGKTHIIAKAVAAHGGDRELILTHTHAGVEAIRERLARMNVPAKAFHVDTIAGWALRLATAFPKTSALSTLQPRNSKEFLSIYESARRLLQLRPIQEIMCASYSGVYVDEYQDCSVAQHAIVCALLDILPCRIVGDPLQGIFDFGDNEPIQWKQNIDPLFEAVDGPNTAWRWEQSNPALGEWLRHVRDCLMAGKGISLKNAPITWIDGSNSNYKLRRQLKACFDLAKGGESVIAIHQMPNQCQFIASRLKSRYSCVEAIELDELYNYASLIKESHGYNRAVAVLDFAGICMTAVKSKFGTIRRALVEKRVPKVRTHMPQVKVLLDICEEDSLYPVISALHTMVQVPGAHVYRRELMREMERAINAVLSGDSVSLLDAAWLVRNRTRRLGRILPRCAVGTTLLVKGLEFDHAIVLDADNYNARNLYVALTRGSKSLTIVSKKRHIEPKDVFKESI